MRTLETKFLEKKIFEKRYLNVFPRWDYKVACYSPAKLVNINPLYTEQSSGTPILVLLSNDATLNWRPYRCSGSPPSDTDRAPETVYYIVSNLMVPDRGSVGPSALPLEIHP